ncbi:MAG: hypothetical protein PVSMB1_06210 [Gemmatimonadaceae bacterium]
MSRGRPLTDKPILIATWAAASWAIEFYRGNGFSMVTPEEKDRLLRTYWSIPEQQVETSILLADSRWTAALQRDRTSRLGTRRKA